jgi:hypothetical protein
MELLNRSEDSGGAADHAEEIMKLIGSQEPVERPPLRAWLADFKRKEAERESARAPLSVPEAEDMAPAEDPGQPPIDPRHYRSWLSKVEHWFRQSARTRATA